MQYAFQILVKRPIECSINECEVGNIYLKYLNVKYLRSVEK